MEARRWGRTHSAAKIARVDPPAPGFMSHLAELQFQTADKHVAMIGAGGSTRAILAALCVLPQRPASIRIYNRTTSRVEELLADLAQRLDVSIVESVISVDDLQIDLCDLLINTTSVGMRTDDECLVAEDLLHSGLLVYDIIYNPVETKLLKTAKQCGARTSNGLGMLYYQGILSLQHWANMEIDDKIKNKIRETLANASS